MAVQFDAAADRLTHSGAYPQTSAGWTYTAWVRIDADRNTNQTWLRVNNGSTIATCGTGGNGTGGPAYFTPAGSAERTADLSSPATGVWVPVAGARSASTGDIKTYCKPSGTGSTTLDSADLTVGQLTDTPNEICLGGRSASDATEWLQGSVAYVRIWSSELSQVEIEAEWASATPVKSSTLHSNWPLSTNTDLTDTVGSKTLAVQSGGSLTTVTGPDLGETVEGALAGTAPMPSGALTGTETAPGELAATTSLPTGALTGDVVDAGALAGSTPLPTGALTATSTDAGALAGTTPALSGALGGDVSLVGALAGTAPMPVGALAAEQISGALAGTSPLPTGALAGTVAMSGALAGVTPLPVAALRQAREVDYPIQAGTVIDNSRRYRPGTVIDNLEESA